MRHGASIIFGDEAFIMCPPTMAGLLGNLEGTQCLNFGAFAFTFLETWTWAKHGRISALRAASFRQRLGQLSIRGYRAAGLDRALMAP